MEVPGRSFVVRDAVVFWVVSCPSGWLGEEGLNLILYGNVFASRY